jgi:hypothetical protein
MKNDIDYLIRAFGSAAEVARAAKVTRGAVTRWKEGRTIDPRYQISVLVQAKRQGLPVDRVARAIGIRKCPACGYIHDHRLRQLLEVEAV